MRPSLVGRPGGSEAAAYVLAAAGFALLLLGTFLPYVQYRPGEKYAVFDFDHLGTTWASGLSYPIGAGAVLAAVIGLRNRPRRLGAFLIGLGLVVFLDFLGAFVIAPTTYVGSADLKWGGVLGAIGGALLIAAGAAASGSSKPEPDPGAPSPSLGWVEGRRLRTVFLAAIGVNAACGIAGIVFGDFNDVSDLEVKAVGSSLSVTIGVLVALGCYAALRRRSLKPIPAVGIGLSAVGFGLTFAGVWGQWSSTQFWKIAGTGVVAALACLWASLLTLHPLRAFHPLRIASLALVLAVGVTGIAAIWGEPSNSGFWRTFGTLGLLVTGTTIAVIAAPRRTAVEM